MLPTVTAKHVNYPVCSFNCSKFIVTAKYLLVPKSIYNLFLPVCILLILTQFKWLLLTTTLPCYKFLIAKIVTQVKREWNHNNCKQQTTSNNNNCLCLINSLIYNGRSGKENATNTLTWSFKIKSREDHSCLPTGISK